MVISHSSVGIVVEGCVFFDKDLYLFAQKSEEGRVESLDERVSRKLISLGEGNLVFEVEKLDDKEDNSGKDGGKGGGVSDQDDGDEKRLVRDVEKDKKKTDDEPEPIAKPGSSVDVDSLPDDIKKAVVSTETMDEDQLNSVLSEIGDSVVKSLKRANVKDTELYTVTGKIQSSVYNILTGKRPKEVGGDK
jgi:hypothetical protein